MALENQFEKDGFVKLFFSQLNFARGDDVAGFADKIGEVPITTVSVALLFTRQWLDMFPNLEGKLELVSSPRRVGFPEARDAWKKTLVLIFGKTLFDGTFTQLDDQNAVLSANASLAFWEDLHTVAVQADELIQAPGKLEEFGDDLGDELGKLNPLPSGNTLIVVLLLLGLVLVLK